MTKYNADNERIKRKYFAYLKEAIRNSEATVDATAKALARGLKPTLNIKTSKHFTMNRQLHSRNT